MKRIAAPMLGGVGTGLLLVLIVFPAIFSLWRGWNLQKTSTKVSFAEDSKQMNKE
jgi:Cu(I)/Ag(I) efflux system membrane protein CusA/SilA